MSRDSAGTGAETGGFACHHATAVVRSQRPALRFRGGRCSSALTSVSRLLVMPLPHVAVRDIGSIRVLEKCGFRRDHAPGSHSAGEFIFVLGAQAWCRGQVLAAARAGQGLVRQVP
jgi:hypothetical protein